MEHLHGVSPGCSLCVPDVSGLIPLYSVCSFPRQLRYSVDALASLGILGTRRISVFEGLSNPRIRESGQRRIGCNDSFPSGGYLGGWPRWSFEMVVREPLASLVRCVASVPVDP